MYFRPSSTSTIGSLLVSNERLTNEQKLGYGNLNSNQNQDSFDKEIETEISMSSFRLFVKKTQMFNYMLSQIECFEFEPTFLSLGVKGENIAEQWLDSSMERFLWGGKSWRLI
jgi:hypothetical protein